MRWTVGVDRQRWWSWRLAWLPLLLLGAEHGGSTDVGLHGCVSDPAQVARQRGQRAFVTPGAIELAGSEYRTTGCGFPQPWPTGRTVHAFEPDMLALLHGLRGLQLIEVADPRRPRRVGRYPLMGTPFALHLHGALALAVLNDVERFELEPDGRATEHHSALVAVIDISDPRRPRLLDSMNVEGNIRHSHLRSGSDDGGAVLYLASQHWDEDASVLRSLLTSHALRAGKLERREQLDLATIAALDRVDGFLQADDDTLLVRSDPREGRTALALVELGDPDGAFGARGALRVEGELRLEDVALADGVLRLTTYLVAPYGPLHRELPFAFDVRDLARISPLRAGSARSSESGSYAYRAQLGERVLDLPTGVVNLYANAAGKQASEPLARARTGLQAHDVLSAHALQAPVAVPAADGTPEPGLLLVPFSDDSDDPGAVRVKTYTFSERTITPRATVACGRDRPHAFVAAGRSIAYVSYDTLALFDPAQPERTQALGTLALAPEYDDVLPFGSHLALQRREDDGACGVARPPERHPWGQRELALVARDGELHDDRADARLTFVEPAGVLKVGELLAGIEYTRDGPFAEGVHTRVQLFDMRDPRHPRRVATAETQDVANSHCDRTQRDLDAVWSVAVPCERSLRGDVDDGVFALPDALVFTFVTQAGSGQLAEPDCVQPPCEETPSAPARRQLQLRLKPLDLRDPARPSFGPLLTLPDSEYLLAVFGAGTSLYAAFADSVVVLGDARPHLRYFYRRIDFAVPSAPVVGPAINVPGELVAVAGERVYTRELIADGSPEQRLHALEPDGGEAVLLASFVSDANAPGDVIVAGERVHVLQRFRAIEDGGVERRRTVLATLSREELALLGEAPLEACDHLLAVDGQRAICAYRDAVAVYDVRDPDAARARAFAKHALSRAAEPTRAWLDGELLLIAGGRAGIVSLELPE